MMMMMMMIWMEMVVEGVMEEGHPLSAKLAAYGGCLAFERRLREAEEDKVGDEAFEFGAGGVDPPILRGMSLLGEGVTVQRLAMLGCWIRCGRRTLQGRGFVGQGGLILVIVVRGSLSSHTY
jgi:hypothetical protein